VIVCDACGATNRSEAAVCRACGRPLPGDGASEPPLPPLPDGGLASGMPDWLSAPLPSRAEPPPPDAVAAAPATADASSDLHDPRTWLTEDDLPLWIRRLGEPRPVCDPAASAADGSVAARSRRPGRADEPVRASQRPAAPAPTASARPHPIDPTPAPGDVRPSAAVSLWLIAGAVVVAVLVLVLLLVVSGGH